MKASACLAAVFLLLIGVPAQASDEWEFMFAPYLWASGLDGETTVLTRTAEVDSDFGDIVDVLDGAFLGHFEAAKGRWTVLGDLIFMDLGQGSLDLEQMIVEAAGGYGVAEDVDFLFGVRYSDIELDVDFGGPIGVIGAETDWTDYLVGLRWTPDLGDRWGASLRADVAGGDSDLTWQIRALGTYRASDLISIGFGYRLMDIDLDEGSGATRFVYDMEMSGVEAGIGFHF